MPHVAGILAVQWQAAFELSVKLLRKYLHDLVNKGKESANDFILITFNSLRTSSQRTRARNICS